MEVYEVSIGSRKYRVQIERVQGALSTEQEKSKTRDSEEIFLNVRLGERETSASCQRINERSLSLIVDGKSYEVLRESSGEVLRIMLAGKRYNCFIHDPRSLRNRIRKLSASALLVHTSKTFALFETGEALERHRMAPRR